jgi:hypothetical protein
LAALPIFVTGAELPLIQAEQLKSDLALVRSALEEAHPGLYRYTSEAELGGEWDRTAKVIDHPMSALEFYQTIGPVLALIKDGHLGLGLPSEAKQYLDKIPILPLGVRLIQPRALVLRDLSETKSPSTGLAILSVNGIPAGELIATMWKNKMGDGDVESSRRRALSLTFGRDLVRTCHLRPPYVVVLHDPKSDTNESRRYDGILPAKLTSDWQTRWPNDSELMSAPRFSDLRFLNDNRIAVMRVPSFGTSESDAKQRDLRGFFADSFRQLKEKGSRALIIDVRNNGGGEDEAGQILASYLMDGPFRYYRDLIVKNGSLSFSKFITSPDPIPPERIIRGEDGQLHFTGHPNLGMKTPRDPVFRGELFIVMNGFSFSTTAEFLAVIRSKRPATFIGEESGGAFAGNNSGFEPVITLPNSKLTVRIPLLAYYVDVSDKYPLRRGTLPDRLVESSIEDMIAGADGEMELALSLAKKSIAVGNRAR